MNAASAGVLAALVIVGALAVAIPAAAQPASPGAPPPVLNLVRVRIKPGSSAAYETQESTIARTWERARIRVYWIALQSPNDARDVLYLNLFSAPDDVDRATARYNDAVKQHPDLVKLQQRLTDLTAGSTTTLTTHRDDGDHGTLSADFATMHALRLTMFWVRAGREGDFLRAIRTANAKDGEWLAYEANDAPIFALVTPRRTTRTSRRDGPAIPRSIRRAKGAYTRVESKMYAVRPSMSHVPQTFIAASPQFWRPNAGQH